MFPLNLLDDKCGWHDQYIYHQPPEQGWDDAAVADAPAKAEQMLRKDVSDIFEKTYIGNLKWKVQPYATVPNMHFLSTIHVYGCQILQDDVARYLLIVALWQKCCGAIGS